MLPGMMVANTAMERSKAKQQPRVEQPVSVQKQETEQPQQAAEEPKQQKPKESQEMQELRHMLSKLALQGGIRRNAAIGILANLSVESPGFDPAKEQIGGGPGRGLAQWEKGGRFDTDRINLVKFAKTKGKPWTDRDTQLDFIIYELNHHSEFKRVKARLNKAKTPAEAAIIFLKQYEKAGKPHTERRIKEAKRLAKMLALPQHVLDGLSPKDRKYFGAF